MAVFCVLLNCKMYR